MTEELRFGAFTLLPQARQLLVQSRPMTLGARAFDLLLALVEHRDRVVGKAELLDLVWPGLVVEENNLQVQISTLRKLLGPNAIATIPGRGYRFTLAEDSGVPVLPQRATKGPSASPRGNLPEAPLRVIGRDEDIETLCARIRNHRAVSVVGAGGIGKTRLALAAAQALSHEFAEGAWIVELAPLTEPALLPATVAQALGLTLPGRRVAMDELVDDLRDRELLLVLDNCEHLVDAVSTLAEALLSRTVRVHVLATSQELLKVGGEQLYRLGALAVPNEPTLPGAAGFGAVALFVERTRALQPGFDLNEDNVADVVDVCRRLDGLPLAIELAAARVPLLGVAGVRERLNERFRMLTGGARAAPRRHQTLRETLDWSHGLLTEDERAVFRRTGVFAGSFSLRSAQQVLADSGLDEWAVLDHLGTLVDKSLLAADKGEPPRYRLLESTRAYALEKLREAGETDAVLHRHAQSVLAGFEQSQAEKWRLTAAERLERWLPEVDNLRVALDWAHEAGQADLEVALAGASAWLWRDSGQRIEGLRRCDRARSRIGSDTPPAQEALLQLEWSALSHPRAGAPEIAAAERAVALYGAIGDRKGLYLALSRLALAAATRGDAATAEDAAEQARQAHDPEWPPLSRWHLLDARGFFLHLSGRHEEADAVAEESLRLAQAVGDAVLMRAALVSLEQNAAAMGRFEEAAARGRKLVDLLRPERSGHFAGAALANLATALTFLGELDEALVIARQAVTPNAQAGTLWSVLDPLALLACKRGRIRAAALTLGRAESQNEWRRGKREPNEQRARDEVFGRLQQALDPNEFAQLLAQGAALSDEDAARLALSGD